MDKTAFWETIKSLGEGKKKTVFCLHNSTTVLFTVYHSHAHVSPAQPLLPPRAVILVVPRAPLGPCAWHLVIILPVSVGNSKQD